MEESPGEIRSQIVGRFSRLARDPASEKLFPVGSGSARRLGYDSRRLEALPEEVQAAFAGVGNPLSLLRLRAGQALLDVGCGSGLDLLLAAEEVGPHGRAVGLDMTAEMLATARIAGRASSAARPLLVKGLAEALPFADSSFDAVITNGVINLCPDKRQVAREIRRVLKPGGNLAMADILLDARVTPEEVARKGAWSD